jgi:uncharacterized membrane protein YkoI
MPNLSRTHLTTVAAVVAAALGGTAIANAASSSSDATTSSTPSTPSTATPQSRPAPEKALTGTTADKVKAAALAKVPGTVLRVEEDRGGVYEAHIRKADGTEVEVAVDKEFNVTAVEEHSGGRGGRGGRGDREDLAAVATTLGVTEAKLGAAVEAARPDNGSRPERGDRAAALAKALGVEISAVQKVLDANRPARGADGAKPARGDRPDQTDLIAALAKGLSIDEAKVKTALEAAETAHRGEHEAERKAMYAAVAKALDKSAAEVEAAFEAARPARSTR